MEILIPSVLIVFGFWIAYILFKNKKDEGHIPSEYINTLRAFERTEAIRYTTAELIKLGFKEYAEGCFIYGENFKVVFSVTRFENKMSLPLQVINRLESGVERKYEEYMDLYSITHVRYAYTKLTGLPL